MALAARWPILALFASLAMLAAAHAFERLGGLAPCALCLKQREIYWGAAGIAAAALLLARVRPSPRGARLAAFMLGFVFLAGAAIAAYHVAVEQHWVIARCEAGSDLSAIRTLGSGPISVPQCDQPAWFLFGITMAGYNAMISLALAGASFWAARHA